MADVFTQEQRSVVMSAIRSADTKPELRLRKALHRLGYRYVLHDRRLPGKPDVVLPRFQTAIQIRGCFWHSCPHCNDGHVPKSRRHYWIPKLEGNKRRDSQNDRKLRRAGWTVFVVWECRCSSTQKLEREVARITRHLSKKERRAH